MIKPIKEILEEHNRKKFPKNIAYEFQDYGVRISQELNDLSHKTFYIKLAKEYPRSFLDQAKEYALAYTKARSKAKIFMWFLKQLKDKRETSKKLTS